MADTDDNLIDFPVRPTKEPEIDLDGLVLWDDELDKEEREEGKPSGTRWRDLLAATAACLIGSTAGTFVVLLFRAIFF